MDGLLELCGSSGLDVPASLDGVERLAPYGVHMRYGASRETHLDRDRALLWAADAIEWAQSLIDRHGG